MKAGNKDITFTVIVAAWNGVSTLQRCIDSVEAQTCPAVELVIIDAGSTDGTKDILRLNDQKIFYWESKPDRGIAHAWNKALKHAQGEWVCFLGADDYFWNSSVLNDVHCFIQEYGDAPRVIYGKVNVVDELGGVLGKYGEEWCIAKKRIFESMPLPHQGVFHHQSLFLTYGEFDEHYKVGPDYEFLLRALIDGEALLIPNLTVTGMQQGGLSSDPDFALLALKDIRRAAIQHSTSGANLKWYMIYMRAVIRRAIVMLFGDNVAQIITSYYRRLSRDD
jgi:hypothetical protein